MEKSVPAKWEKIIMNVLEQVVKEKLEQLNALEYFDYPISSLEGIKQLNLKSKRLCFKVRRGSDVIKMSFTASTVFFEPSDGTDFTLEDKYGLWRGNIDEDGNNIDIRFIGKSEQHVICDEFEEIVLKDL